VDELHAVIAEYLRQQRRLAVSEAALLAIWYERCGVPYCRYCGKAITEGDDAFDVEQMRAARACVDHFAPF